LKQEDAIDFRNSISDDDYIFSCWISPSGKGVKALVKIPKDIENHKEYFKALKNYYNHPNWDDSGSDVSRFCFESYDSDLFINENSKLWDKIDLPELEDIGSKNVSIAIKSDNLIITNLLKWFNSKYTMADGQRNSNLFKLASAFNDFGINKNVAEQTLLQYQTKDFDNKEIRRYQYLKRRGWYRMFINSPCDYVPSDEILLTELSKALMWFESDEKYHHHYERNFLTFQ